MTARFLAAAAWAFAPCVAFAHDDGHDRILLAQAGEDAAVAPVPDATPVATTDLGHGLFMMTGEGGNLLLSVGEDGPVLVDDQFERMVPAISAAVAERSADPVRIVVNTHWHGDHTGGNAVLGGLGAVIVAQENVRRRMSSEQDMAPLGGVVPPSPPEALPLITYDDDIVLHVNGHDMMLTHVPNGHTDGDSIIVIPDADVMHMGDLFFNGSFPVIDIASGGSIDGMIAGLGVGLEMAGPETKIVPGHGPLGDREAMEAARDLLIDIRGRIAPLVEQGMDVEDVVAAQPLADLDAEYGGGFMTAEMQVRVAYASLARDITAD